MGIAPMEKDWTASTSLKHLNYTQRLSRCNWPCAEGVAGGRLGREPPPRESMGGIGELEGDIPDSPRNLHSLGRIIEPCHAPPVSQITGIIRNFPLAFPDCRDNLGMSPSHSD